MNKALRDLRNDEIFRQRMQGHTYQYIGDIYDLSRERVRQIIEEMCNKELGYPQILKENLTSKTEENKV